MVKKYTKYIIQFLIAWNKHVYRFYFLYFILTVVLIWTFRDRGENITDDDYINEEPSKVQTKDEDLSCQTSRNGDALQLLMDYIIVPANAIFFHDTSCKSGLTSRQACAVESAAKANPDRQINVLFTAAIPEYVLYNSSLRILQKNYKNIQFRRVLIRDYAKGTPLESIVKTMSFERLAIYITEIMKYLTLYKYSGIYLSLDAVVARKLNLSKNWAVKNTQSTLSNDMLAFSDRRVGRKLANTALGFLRSKLLFNNELTTNKTPSVISQMLQTWCHTDKVDSMTQTTCPGMSIYGPELFYPISFRDKRKYFKVEDWQAWKKKEIYIYYIWEHLSKFMVVKPDSLHGNIANEYCPNVYKHYGSNFGLWYADW